MSTVSLVGEHAASAATRDTTWGVDTINTVTSPFLERVDAYLGRPQFVGRYLFVEGATDLRLAEASLLHAHGIPILLITSPRNGSLTSAAVAVSEARGAVRRARELGVPRGVALFRDVENSYSINASYVVAWYETVKAAGYTPGFYANPLELDQFNTAYCYAVSKLPGIASTALYSNENELPSYGFSRAGMPSWGSSRPGCPNTTVAWQYKESYSGVNVDVDEFNSRYSSELWGASTPHLNVRHRALTHRRVAIPARHTAPAHRTAPVHRAIAVAAPIHAATPAPALAHAAAPAPAHAAAPAPVHRVATPAHPAAAPAIAPAAAKPSNAKAAGPFEANTGAIWLGPARVGGGGTWTGLGITTTTSPAVTTPTKSNVAGVVQADTDALWP